MRIVAEPVVSGERTGKSSRAIGSIQTWQLVHAGVVGLELEVISMNPIYSRPPPEKDAGFTLPPPPTAPELLDINMEDVAAVPGPRRRSSKRPRPIGNCFEAEVDMAELDDRDRPLTTWTARAFELSRSNLIIRSRRMCYVGKLVMVAVHLIDDQPVPLFGKVYSCDYDGDGLYKVDLDLLPVPDRNEIRAWLGDRG